MKITISRRELINKFRNLGFDGPYSGGRHQFMKKGEIKVCIPNPHKSKEIHIRVVPITSISSADFAYSLRSPR